MPYLDLSTANPALLEYIDGQTLQKMVYSTNPLLALLRKDEEVGGKYYPLPCRYGNAMGRSSTFSNAQANQTAPPYAEFLLTRKRDYGIATIDNETLEASLSDKGAFLRLGTDLVESAVSAVSTSVASALFRSGTGTIGQVSATVAIASGVITLANPADIVQFEVGQTLQANATDGGTPRATLGYVVAVSIRNGTITVSDVAIGGAAGTPVGWTTSDFLLVQGDLNAKPPGLPGWLPMTDPTTSDNFYGVNRSVSYRLFGVQYSASGQSIEEGITDHTMLLARESAMTSHYVTNFGSCSALTKALGTKVIYEDMVGPAGIAFQSLKINGPNGPIRVVPDRSCAPKAGFALDLDTWVLASIGAVPKVLRYQDRLEFLRVVNADAAECRVGAYYSLGCKAPFRNGQTLLPT